MTRTDENREHCKHIAHTLEKYIDGSMYKCPYCDNHIEWDDDNYDEENELYTCPDCGATMEENELEALSLYDYFDDVFDIEYRIGSDRQLRSVCVMVGCGGPNIYIDTGTKAVELYWWTERASYYLTDEAVEAVNDFFEELYNC